MSDLELVLRDLGDELYFEEGGLGAANIDGATDDELAELVTSLVQVRKELDAETAKQREQP